MFDSTRMVLLFASKGQIGSWLRRSDHLTRTVDPRQRMRGFSVVELLTTVIILLVVSAMAVFQMQPMWQQIQANAGLDQVKSTLRQARELAISDRRTIVVQFLNRGNWHLLPTRWWHSELYCPDTNDRRCRYPSRSADTSPGYDPIAGASNREQGAIAELRR